MRLKEQIRLHVEGLLAAYGQLFFSENKWFSVCVALASFVDFRIGIVGALFVVLTHLFAHAFQFGKQSIRQGLFGFNALLTGLYMGYMYQLNLPMFFFSVVLCLVLFLLTAGFQAYLSSRKLPYLSLPFLFAVWLVELASTQFKSFLPNQNTIFIHNELMQYGGESLVNMYQKWSDFHFPEFWEVYLKSMGAVVFQYNLISGIIITIGLLLYSRIAFMFSLIGFACGLGFTYFLQGSTDVYLYSFIGFNFILTALAIGCYFLIPNVYSLLLVMVITPFIAVIIAASGTFLSSLGLQVLSLPFNIAVLLTIYVLYFREKAVRLHLTGIQLNSPERNLYKFISNEQKYNGAVYYQVGLPFFGEWVISQGHNGAYTHKDHWKHAWDFIIRDDDFKSFRFPGTQLEDYYCYSLPVLAPVSGVVESVIDGIEDNMIGDVNLLQNWGNTIVIRHAPDLFVKLSHLKNGSLKVRTGDYVYKGQILALNGSSGRSPEPHLHFQIQSTPFIGSHTLRYPISFYLTKEDNQYVFHNNGYPKQNEIVCNISVNNVLRDAFNLIPGQTFQWKTPHRIEQWEVYTNAYNQSYIHCHTTQSTVFFVNNGLLFYCTSFSGDKNSVLYAFYLSCQKIVLGWYPTLKIHDLIDVYDVHSGWIRWLNDFVAPIKSVLSVDYLLQYLTIDSELYTRQMELSADIKVSFYKKAIKNYTFRIKLEDGKLISIESHSGNDSTIYTCVPSNFASSLS